MAQTVKRRKSRYRDPMVRYEQEFMTRYDFLQEQESWRRHEAKLRAENEMLRAQCKALSEMPLREVVRNAVIEAMALWQQHEPPATGSLGTSVSWWQRLWRFGQ